jgi:CheY-like chemotaxis protein
MKIARVLVVEDESAIAELIAINLRHNGTMPMLASEVWLLKSTSTRCCLMSSCLTGCCLGKAVLS